MELRPGYKETAVGVIPEDWDAIPVGELFSFKNGLNKAKHFFGHGTPIVNYMDVFGQSGLRAAQIAGRVEVTKTEREAYNVRKGDVFFTRTSETVDEIGVAAAMLDPMKDAVYSGFVLRARPKDASLDDLFKAYCFSPRYFRHQVIERATYTTRALTNGRSLSAALLARPPLPEQKAIAEALSDVDASIAALSRLIAKKSDLRQGAMQRLLTGQTRLPGFTAPWREKRLGDIAHCFSGGTPATSVREYYGGNIPWITSSDLNKGEIVEVPGRISESGLENSAAKFVKANTLLIALYGATAGVPAVTQIDAAINQAVLAIVPKEDNAHFIYRLLALQKDKLVEKYTQGGQPNLSGEIVKSFELVLPDTAEQLVISNVLSDIDAEISAIEASLEKTCALKRAMMQALLTGRVRLSGRRDAAPQTKEAAYA